MKFCGNETKKSRQSSVSNTASPGCVNKKNLQYRSAVEGPESPSQSKHGGHRDPLRSGSSPNSSWPDFTFVSQVGRDLGELFLHFFGVNGDRKDAGERFLGAFRLVFHDEPARDVGSVGANEVAA